MCNFKYPVGDVIKVNDVFYCSHFNGTKRDYLPWLKKIKILNRYE